MKVLMLSTYMSGGAANCAVQLGKAIHKHELDINLSLLMRLGESKSWIHKLTGIDHLKGKWAFYFERLLFWPHERDKSVRFAYSIGNMGVDLSNHPLVKEADIIHLHWISQGLISVEGLKKLAEIGKPIVWSLHDMWAFTGGCHYSGDCDKYQHQCNNCDFPKNEIRP